MTLEDSNSNLINLNEDLFESNNRIREWLDYFILNWKLIIIIGFAGTFLGFLYAKYTKPIYTAKLTFVLEDGGNSSSGLGQYAGLASMVGIDIGGGGGLFQGDNILELYRSRSMIEKTLLSSLKVNNRQQLLIDRFIQSNGLRELWKDDVSLNNISFADSAHFSITQDSIINNIVAKINEEYLSVTKLDKKLNIIKVQFRNSDQLFAEAFTNNIVENVNRFYITTKTKKSLENVKILQDQTDSVRIVMNGSISQAASTLDATPNLNPTRQTLRTSIQKSQFSAETNKAILGELVKNLELSKITLRKETPLIQIIDKPVLPLDMIRIGKIKGMGTGFILSIIIVFVYLVLKKVGRNFNY